MVYNDNADNHLVLTRRMMRTKVLIRAISETAHEGQPLRIIWCKTDQSLECKCDFQLDNSDELTDIEDNWINLQNKSV